MSRRTGLLSFMLVGALGLAGLAVSAARGHRWTASTLNIPALKFAVTLLPGQLTCQSPVRVSAAAGGVEAWAWPTAQPGPPLLVSIRSLAGRGQLASGLLPPGYAEVPPPKGYPSPVSLRTRLSRPLRAGARAAVCLRNVGATNVTLLGAPPDDISGTLRLGPRSTGHALSLVFIGARSQSLFSVLPTAFRRASLFKPSWVGAWTFWLLGAAILGAFALGGLAVSRASRADEPAA